MSTLDDASPDFRFDGPPGAALTLVLAHGAGSGMDSPFMNAMAGALAACGWRVARFEFPYMARRRREGSRRPPDRAPVLEDAYRAAIAALGAPERLVIGGKSMGGRIASMIADACGVRGLVCLGYPFHPPARPERLRTAHLAALATPALIVQGSRDPFGKPEEVAGYQLAAGIDVCWIDDGDHGLVPRKASGRSREQNLEAAAVAVDAFLRGRAG